MVLVHWVTTRLFLQEFWGFCQCMMATLLNPLAWSSQKAFGHSSPQGWAGITLQLPPLALAVFGQLLEVVWWPCWVRGQMAMGSLAYPPAEAGKDSVAPWHGQVLLWEPGTAPKAAESTTAPAQPFVALPAEQNRPQKHEEWQLCTPSSFFFFSSHKASSKLHTSNILFEGCKCPGVYLPRASSCSPLVSLQHQNCV